MNHLASCQPTNSLFFPEVIESQEDLGTKNEVTRNFAVKLAATTASFTTQWMVENLKLPHRVVDQILWTAKEEKLLEILGQTGPLEYKFRITKLGLELAKRLMDLCGYLGPAPVSLDEYIASVKAQSKLRHTASMQDIKQATSELTLDEQILEVAALAYSSNRSLFIFGPPGNGKSSLGRSLHDATKHYIWIPYAIAVDNQVIRVFDPQYHHLAPATTDESLYDHRWVHIELPFVMTGGELTMDELDLVYDSTANFYEAPPHLKANCGTYFIDDLGRQRIDPFDLLNRWIVPLEQGIDFLTFLNGKKIEIPFQMMLIVATNLKTSEVADAAFLRRMGYRIHLNNPSEQEFRTIFQLQADRMQIEVAPKLLDRLIARYRHENRPWRASEPRDLLLRCLDVIRFRNAGNLVDESVMNVAWIGYFSDEMLDAVG